jgi:nicotinate-nucleotide adenylyltransferase
MKIGLFFGSFNPVHSGHLIIAGYMAEFTDLDRVWLVVSPHNPLKEKSSLLADHHRFQMVQRCIEDYKKLKASDIEFKMPQPSYTIDTLARLKSKYPAHTFVLIMGADNLSTFHKWRNYEQIQKAHEIYVYPRKGTEYSAISQQNNIRLIASPLVEISSSFIRKAIRDKKDIRYMMPAPAYNYLKEMHFYEK